MIKVKIKTDKNLRLNIPIPYAILKAGCSLLTSEMFLKNITKWANHHSEHKTNISFIPLNSKLSKELVKQTIGELRCYEGLILVDVKLKDGTEVSVKL
ncbi:hypothetical protein [Bacillus sp. T33-2]|uniref:hypothetical protein n=1 Tax=Bacillus sp. T33-2 TaxID=2054168 RepID=UPI000C76290B|nr:hypothetical protein [Bacillus sp. T33-2]PLR89079.1 hypothetical protein CVD19_24115 [Bacillus sp. T33-2]